MNSFNVFAVGLLAQHPELFVRDGRAFALFCLVGTDFKEVDEAVREYVTYVWFVAPDPIASVLFKNCKGGDQLIVEARVLASHWMDGQEQKWHENVFEVLGFRYGTTKGGEGSPVVYPLPSRQPPTEENAETIKKIAAT